VRRPALAVLGLSLAAAGCGTGGGPLRVTAAQPPEGAQEAATRNSRQGSNDPDAGKPVYRVAAREGLAVSYQVTVRNTGNDPVEVTGVVADSSRDGAFVPERVEGAPVRVGPGEQTSVAVAGHVRGCKRYGGQVVPVSGPEFRLKSDSGESTEEVAMPIRIELQTGGCA
jgi:hypothetical protein